MPKFKAGKQVTANEAFIMSAGQKVGNLKGRSSAPKPVHKTAKAGDPNRRGAGPQFNKPQKSAPLQPDTGTTYSGVGNAMAKGPYKDRHQSLGKVNSGFKVH